MLLLLILAAPPPPSSAYVLVKNQGVSQGYARQINCSGSGITCAVNTTTAEATLTVSASGSSDAGSIAIPNCAAGYVLDADGGVLYCINTIANATLAATATALAANPADCSSGQYANAIAASGDLTCAAVATSQLSGTITNAQLASLYSGVGACAANTWASTLVSNSTPTCTQPDFNNIHGQVTDAQLDGGYSGYGACGSHQWASTLSRNASPTCTQPATIDLSGQISDAQLDGGYSGVGACGTHQWASTLSRNASPTCTQPNYTDLAGCEPGQGVAGAVQYNSAACEGGVSNFISDGTNVIALPVSTHPATPNSGATEYNWSAATDSGFPPIPFMRDIFTGSAIPLGVLSVFGEGASANNWTWQSYRMTGYNVNPIGVNGGAATATSWTSFGAWANTSLLTRIYWIQGSPAASGNTGATLIAGSASAWLGNAAGAGGFIFWQRFALHVTPAHMRLFMGLSNGSTAFTTAEPSAQTNTVYFGCDNGPSPDSNVHVCSNDNSGSATCKDLGSNFPCRTADAIYDTWLAAPPQATYIAYYIERLDVSNVATGTITSDLPQNTVQLRPFDEVNTGDAGTAPTAYFNAWTIAFNF